MPPAVNNNGSSTHAAARALLAWKRAQGAGRTKRGLRGAHKATPTARHNNDKGQRQTELAARRTSSNGSRISSSSAARGRLWWLLNAMPAQPLLPLLLPPLLPLLLCGLDPSGRASELSSASPAPAAAVAASAGGRPSSPPGQDEGPAALVEPNGRGGGPIESGQWQAGLGWRVCVWRRWRPTQTTTTMDAPSTPHDPRRHDPRATHLCVDGVCGRDGWVGGLWMADLDRIACRRPPCMGVGVIRIERGATLADARPMPCCLPRPTAMPLLQSKAKPNPKHARTIEARSSPFLTAHKALFLFSRLCAFHS